MCAAQFRSSAGMAIVTKDGSSFFTDSRYTEAARKVIAGAEISWSTAERPVEELANEAIEFPISHWLFFIPIQLKTQYLI